MTRRALIVYNPAAKSTAEPADWLPDVTHELCEKSDYIVTLFATAPGLTPRDLIPLVNPPLDLIVAAGGDGTVGFTVSAVAESGSDIPIGIIPLGTANVLARTLRIMSSSMFELQPGGR